MLGGSSGVGRAVVGCAIGSRGRSGETHDADARDGIFTLSRLSQHDIGFVLGEVGFGLFRC